MGETLLELVPLRFVPGVPRFITDFTMGVGEVCIGLPVSESCPGLLAHGVKAGNGTPPLLDVWKGLRHAMLNTSQLRRCQVAA